MNILEQLTVDATWCSFFEYKLSKGHLNNKEQKELKEFIEKKEYLSVTDHLYSFDYPTKKLINKMGSTKKRVVYTYSVNETWVLKLISYLLYDYDYLFSDNIYSFRKNNGVKKAVRKITSQRNIDNFYCYKVDISNYFNSINTKVLLKSLKDIFDKDESLYVFFNNILNQDASYQDGELVVENRGIMAGVPIAPFLANVYLKGLDEIFAKKHVIYARYSDDIIVFAEEKEDLDQYISIIKNYLSAMYLSVNTQKEEEYNPGEKWKFLGISYKDKIIDLSDATIDKMKGKLKRKARAIYRWKLRKNVSDETAMKTYIKIFNNKFYEVNKVNDLTWSRWFFPLINSAEGLSIIDKYMQQCIRYIATGKHSKANYRTTYEKLKAMGYRPLVSEFYNHKDEVLKNVVINQNRNN